MAIITTVIFDCGGVFLHDPANEIIFNDIAQSCHLSYEIVKGKKTRPIIDCLNRMPWIRAMEWIDDKKNQEPIFTEVTKAAEELLRFRLTPYSRYLEKES